MENGSKEITRIRNSGKIVLFIFCAFMILGNYSSIRSGAGLFDFPYGYFTEYYNNKFVKFLNMSSFLIDILICINVSLFFCGHEIEKVTKTFSMILLFIGIFLIWLELYYGSTFSYGGVRDLQTLPLCVNNFGVLGSTIFLRQIFKDMAGIPPNIFNKFPFIMAVLLNISLSLALNKAWTFYW